MSADRSVIDRWHALVAARDLTGLDELLADEVVFQSPAVHSPQVGRVLTRRYLESALRVLNNESFRYVGEWFAERSAVLEFETVIAEGRIVHFKVMVRPIKALQALMPLIAAELQRGACSTPG
jgi:hypothetical protein